MNSAMHYRYATLALILVRARKLRPVYSLMDVSQDGTRFARRQSDNGSSPSSTRRIVAKRRRIEVGGKLEGVTWIGGGPWHEVTVTIGARRFLDTEAGQGRGNPLAGDPRSRRHRRGSRWSAPGSRTTIPAHVSEIDLEERTVITQNSGRESSPRRGHSTDEVRLYVTESPAKRHARLATGQGSR